MRTISLVAACLLGGGVAAADLAGPAYGSDFTTFAQDEDVCRRVGAAAVGGGSGPAAAQRYDMAHYRCMIAHGRRRSMSGGDVDGPDGAGLSVGNPHGFKFPDAFYSIPYATPGYGYDGFGY